MDVLDLQFLIKYMYNNIQSDYSYRITPIYRRAIVNIVIRVQLASNIEVAESSATVVCQFIAWHALEPLFRGSGL
jgi:hypothetical protein